MSEYVSYLTETMAICLFSAFGLWCGALSLAMYNLQQTITRLQVSSDILVRTLGKKLAFSLHDPDDHNQLDELCEQYDLNSSTWTVDEWNLMKQQCDRVSRDESAPPPERMRAGILAAVCVYEAMARFKAELPIDNNH